MVYGIGGTMREVALENLSDMTINSKPIQEKEYQARVHKAQSLMKHENIKAIYINAGTNLTYFTGIHWSASERMVGALLPANGNIQYISPNFEIGTLKQHILIPGKIHAWEEHENPYRLFEKMLKQMDIFSGNIGLDESAPFFITNGLSKINRDYRFTDASSITAKCRRVKSSSELALIQTAMNMTIEVQKAAASILYKGITTREVEDFIHTAHQKTGAKEGSYFVIVLFGKATSFPHGVTEIQTLKENDIVLIDTGCKLHDYISDITRTYIFGKPTNDQTKIWNIEKEAQLSAFKAVKPGVRAGDVDLAARAVLEKHGLGPNYQLPGLPHRTGHGIGLDIHEWPYLNMGDDTLLEPGMCFSNEPMICVPDQFGIRHEDHFHVTKNGAQWFTTPSFSIENPFGYQK